MHTHNHLHRKKIRVSGVVQGVGFRPFVYRIAQENCILGWVRNTSGSVEIDAEGSSESIEAFITSLRTDAPVLANIETITAIEADPAGYDKFDILESQSESINTAVIPADVATCEDCTREIASTEDRRHNYAFTNCTNCGPRFTIIHAVPYDRAYTTMSIFEMCPDCAAEYRDPANRRFHAEPTACPICGPHIWLEQYNKQINCDTLVETGKLLSEGMVMAIKGLGGFHLSCDARNDTAVQTLRTRKGRAAKPFAIMVKDIAEAEKLCVLDDSARNLLLSRQKPIVLAKMRDSIDISEYVAPGNRFLGLMLPYTPLHILLFKHSPSALVMTSANLSEEPLVFTNSSARVKLPHLADMFLMHNRDIHVPCDDSVVKPLENESIIIRRSRGYVPDSIELPIECDCILGTGAEQKNTFCLAWDKKAVLSQHIGDLDTVETFDYYKYAIEHFFVLFQREPKVIAHDIHPGYMSTHYAKERSNIKLIGVQHHHAHIASCLAEHKRTEKCIGIALDGTGYGTDGTIWGGEILVADLSQFNRVGRLAQVYMPGGESAIRDPRRMAMAYLHAVYGEDSQRIAEELGLKFTPLESRVIRHQLETGLNSPLTSSAGRLFDALSTAVGICKERTYEGQPAIELEMIADENELGQYNASVKREDCVLVPDTLAVFHQAIEDKLKGVALSIISARFHNSLIELMAKTCEEVRKTTGLNLVALSGGVFQNVLMLTRLRDKLVNLGFEVLTHKLLPPNDACISLGQVAIAASKIAGEK